MRLTHVLASVNDNPDYYMFIPKQIAFWKKFNIRFVAIFVIQSDGYGNEEDDYDKFPTELDPYRENIMVWINHDRHINSAFIGQNIRIYATSLLRDLAEDEMVMITDMDMLPMNAAYYTEGLENFVKDDFIYYRHIDGDQIYMCYNAAHPDTWGKVFGISSEEDVAKRLRDTYDRTYDGIPGSYGWYTDQQILYRHLIDYAGLKVLQRPLRRLETWNINPKENFVEGFDDCHFHRSYSANRELIELAERQLSIRS